MKERKSYTTKNRLVILDYLKENCSTTISAADIKKHLEEKEISVNTTTVYRLLDKLCAENIIIKYSDINSDKAVYQYAGEKGHCREHLHLKCIKCGKVMHLDCGYIAALLGNWDGISVTYAGGVSSFEDLRKLKELGRNKVDVTIGSALDLFGGEMPFSKVLEEINF